MLRTCFLSRRAVLPLALLAHLAPAAQSLAEPQVAEQAAQAKQLVIVSFDGAADNRLWQKSREIAKRTGARFTYFLSCTHLIERTARDSYKGPGIKTGRSNVGFAPTAEDAATRLHHIWQAHLEGHEIANHGCGHFDGKDWTSADWLQEFESFDRVLKNAWKANGVADQEPQGWADLVDKGIFGFRAPYLSQSPALATAQRVKGFAYDASQVVRGPVPVDTSGKIASFGLPLIPEGPKNRPIIAMDYNLFVRHSLAVENPSRSAEFEARSYDAFRQAFDREYEGARIPLQLGFHFVEMNGGAYWRAMERLLDEVCHKPDVACVSYAETLRLLRPDDPEQQSSGL